jgi:hypothetical protein
MTTLNDSAVDRFPRTRLAEMRKPLMHLHRALVEASFLEYEREHGRLTSQERLDLLLDHPAFVWLRAISELIVRVDEVLEDASVLGGVVDRVVKQVERLLAPADRDDELGRRHVELLQAHPDVVLAHAALRRAVERGLMN